MTANFSNNLAQIIKNGCLLWALTGRPSRSSFPFVLDKPRKENNELELFVSFDLTGKIQRIVVLDISGWKMGTDGFKQKKGIIRKFPL